MTVEQAAAALRITPSAVRYRLEKGQLHGERIHPRLWLVPVDEVERAVAAGGRMRPGPKPGRKEQRDDGEGGAGNDGAQAR